MRTLIVGNGYVGKRVADLALAAGDTVWASSRKPATAAISSGQAPTHSIIPVQLDVTDSRTLRNVPAVDQVLVSVAYDPKSRAERDDIHVRGLARLLDHLKLACEISGDQGPESWPHVCVISTTGVYHQGGGVWVDERSPTRPRREGGKAHLRGEALLRRQWPSDRHCVLRLAGIYGPGRVPRIRDIAAGRPIPAESEAYLNLIHVDDAAAAVMAAWDRRACGLFCVSDGHPTLRRDYYEHLARCIGVEGVNFVTPDGNANDRARSDSNKRIDNRKLKRELLPRLIHPSCLDVTFEEC